MNSKWGEGFSEERGGALFLGAALCSFGKERGWMEMGLHRVGISQNEYFLKYEISGSDFRI